MNRKHALAVSLLLGLAIAAGAFAATRGGADTAQATISPPAGTTLTDENARIDRYEATLDRLLARARSTRGPSGTSAAVGATATPGPAETQSWDDDDDHGSDDDDHGSDDDDHGSDDDSSGHGSGHDSEHEDDD